MTTGGRSVNLDEGEYLELECKFADLQDEKVQDVLSREATLTFYRANESDCDVIDDKPYSFTVSCDHSSMIELSKTTEGTKSLKLVIEKVVLKDRAFYICSADNKVATYNRTVLVRVKGKFIIINDY